MLDCALISPDEGFRHAVLGMVRQPKHNARVVIDIQIFADRLDRGSVAKIIQSKARVVFLDLGTEPSGAGGIQALSREAPELTLVVVGPALDAEGLLAVMRSGAAEYLPRPVSKGEVEEALQRVRRRVKTAAMDHERTAGRVTTVFSAKGGTGVTTLATNLAAAIRMLTDKRVLLVDLSPAFGTVAVAMGVQPRYTYVDVVHNFHRLDEELFHSFLEVGDSGVYVLASPLSQVGADMPVEEELQTLIDLCRHHFDYVVVDGGSALSSHLGQLLQNSDDRLMVVTPDLPALRNLKQAFDLHGRTNGKTPPKLVLNQYKEGLGLTSRDVEDGLGHRIDLVLEKDDVRVLESLNVGRPEVQVGRSRFAKEIMDFARKLLGPDSVATSPKGLKRLFRRPPKVTEKGKEEAE